MAYYIKINLIKDLESNSQLRHELAVAMELSERAIYNTVKLYLEDPIKNCNFTKFAAIKFFKEKEFLDFLTEEKPAV